jgi:hypothetical protein
MAGETSFEGPVCASRERSSASLRFVTTGAEAGRLTCRDPDGVGPERIADEVDPSIWHRLVVQALVPEYTYNCVYTSAGTSVFDINLSPVAPVTGPVITEVLLDPAGPEPHQEFVEIINPGPWPVDLGGYRITDEDPAGSDDPSSMGDPLPGGVILELGEIALIVAEGFESEGPDPVPPPGAIIVRVDGSIAKSGLRNSGGEPVFLLDDAGLVISSYPNVMGTTGQGSSVHRLGVLVPGNDPANWAVGTPSPGSITLP